MTWTKEDLKFLKKHRDFCVEFYLKGYDLRTAGLIIGEIIKNVEGQNTQGTAQRKIVVRWC